MTDPSLVSVIIPNHNYGRFVEAAVQSVLDQDYGPVEVIVVDNGSTDNSLERLNTFGDQIQVIAQDDLGQAQSRNRGLTESRAEFLAFLDADDTWHRGKLSRQMPLFDRKSVGLVYSSVLLCGPDLEVRGIERAIDRGDCRSAFVERVASAIVIGGETTAIIRRECLDKVGLLEPTLSGASGWDFFRRIAGNYELDFVDDPLANYRQHGANLHLQDYYLNQYYLDMNRAYERLFNDPEWEQFHADRFRVFARLRMAEARDLLRIRRPVASSRQAVTACIMGLAAIARSCVPAGTRRPTIGVSRTGKIQ